MFNNMNKQLKIIVGVVAIVLVVWVIVRGYGTQSADIIKIGYIGPFTGPVAGSSGEDIANGWKLAVSKRPVIAGKVVKMIYEDDACDPKKAADAATKLVTIDNVDIVVNGVCSGSAIAERPIVESHKLVLFTPVSTSPKITASSTYVFRTSGTADLTASAMRDGIIALGYKDASILFENAEYPVGIKDALLKALFGNSIKVINVEEVKPNETDMRSQITKIAQGKPQVIIVIMNSAVTANTFIKEAKELGVKFPIIANEYFAFNVVVQNPDAEGVYATQYKYDPNSSDIVSFLNDYKQMYGKAPGQDIYAALPFDGYNVLASAIEECGKVSDSDCLIQKAKSIKNYQGITGSITILPSGDALRQFTLRKISGGKLVDLQ